MTVEELEIENAELREYIAKLERAAMPWTSRLGETLIKKDALRARKY